MSDPMADALGLDDQERPMLEVKPIRPGCAIDDESIAWRRQNQRAGDKRRGRLDDRRRDPHDTARRVLS